MAGLCSGEAERTGSSARFYFLRSAIASQPAHTALPVTKHTRSRPSHGTESRNQRRERGRRLSAHPHQAKRVELLSRAIEVELSFHHTHRRNAGRSQVRRRTARLLLPSVQTAENPPHTDDDRCMRAPAGLRPTSSQSPGSPSSGRTSRPGNSTRSTMKLARRLRAIGMGGRCRSSTTTFPASPLQRSARQSGSRCV